MSFLNFNPKTLAKVAVVSTMLCMAVGASAQSNVVSKSPTQGANQVLEACKLVKDAESRPALALSLNSVARAMIAAHKEDGLRLTGKNNIKNVCDNIKEVIKSPLNSPELSKAWSKTNEAAWYAVHKVTADYKLDDYNAQSAANLLGGPVELVSTYSKQMALNASLEKPAGDPTGQVITPGKNINWDDMSKVFSQVAVTTALDDYTGPSM